MKMNLKYPQWQEPLAAAILEMDPKKVREKAQAAREAIGVRICELALSKDSRDELRALHDGASLIRVLKQGWLGSTSERSGSYSPSPFRSTRAASNLRIIDSISSVVSRVAVLVRYHSIMRRCSRA